MAAGGRNMGKNSSRLFFLLFPHKFMDRKAPQKDDSTRNKKGKRKTLYCSVQYTKEWYFF
jgi:hypothetical protein